MPGGLVGHVDQDLVQGHLGLRPPRHRADAVEVALGERLERVPPRGPVERDDAVARLVGPGVHVGLRVVVVEREVLRERPAERRAEVPRLHRGQVLDQAEEVRAGRRHRPAQVVLREAVELVQHLLVEEAEAVDEGGLGVRDRHAGIVEAGTAYDRAMDRTSSDPVARVRLALALTIASAIGLVLPSIATAVESPSTLVVASLAMAVAAMVHVGSRRAARAGVRAGARAPLVRRGVRRPPRTGHRPRPPPDPPTRSWTGLTARSGEPPSDHSVPPPGALPCPCSTLSRMPSPSSSPLLTTA